MNPFVRPHPHADPAVRVILFHHAGGSAAMYHAMGAALPDNWELLILDLPGRGKRRHEPVITDMAPLIRRVLDDVRPLLGPRVALFGHSLGAILAAEVAREAEALQVPPMWVGVSGRVAPTLQGQARRLSDLDDATLLHELMRLGGTPDRIHELAELRTQFMRVVRADIAVLESYRPAPDRAALRCPITAFAGTSDVWAPPSTMQPWARETSNSFDLRLFEGGHFFFLGEALAHFTRQLVRDIEPHAE